ncbi:MAG: FeoB-associated Cys-rich membrane protein [Clostridiales bacterium]|nr:FeoB-associated Cys-rich membrane protein [Eubacteriales bacterium]MDH7567188.1 FeoB-associated Cys-rich membrane protein [Clostridiales bacterium]
MINWIVGGLIVGLTVFIIIRFVSRMRKGQACSCGDCAESRCDCGKKA